MWHNITAETQRLLSRAAGQQALRRLAAKYPDPVKWIEQEQKLNDRTIAKGDYPIHPNSVPREFWPEQQPVFWLAEFEAPRDQFRVFQNPTCPLPWYLSATNSECYSHLVHPLTVSYFTSRQIKDWRPPRFLATPTASHRTLLVWQPRTNMPPFMVKTSINVWIGGLNRNIRLKEIKRSVGFSSLLAGVQRPELAHHGILLLDDPVGIVHKQTNAGLLARDAPWQLEAGHEIVPIFSLVASLAGKPRIVDLVLSSGLSAIDWVDKFILKPLIYQAYFLGMTEGIVGEMHEQNILMELRDGVPTQRFWHRDLGGFLLDRNLRRLANKGYESLPARIHERHLGRDIAVFHLVHRMYLQESLGHAVAHALRKYFAIPEDNFAELYNTRASKLQDVILSAIGIRKTKDFVKDLDRYRKRKKPGLIWPWKNQEAALRAW